MHAFAHDQDDLEIARFTIHPVTWLVVELGGAGCWFLIIKYLLIPLYHAVFG